MCQTTYFDVSHRIVCIQDSLGFYGLAYIVKYHADNEMRTVAAISWAIPID